MYKQLIWAGMGLLPLECVTLLEDSTVGLASPWIIPVHKQLQNAHYLISRVGLWLIYAVTMKEREWGWGWGLEHRVAHT